MFRMNGCAVEHSLWHFGPSTIFRNCDLQCISKQSCVVRKRPAVERWMSECLVPCSQWQVIDLKSTSGLIKRSLAGVLKSQEKLMKCVTKSLAWNRTIKHYRKNSWKRAQHAMHLQGIRAMWITEIGYLSIDCPRLKEATASSRDSGTSSAHRWQRPKTRFDSVVCAPEVVPERTSTGANWGIQHY